MIKNNLSRLMGEKRISITQLSKITVNLNVNESIPFEKKKEKIKDCIVFIEEIQREHYLSNALVELNINI